MVNISYHKTTYSTNDLALASKEEWSLFLAEEQTKARGQRGNTWESEPEKNLTFSLVLMPNFLHASKQFIISKIVSLAVVYTLEHYDLEPKIKWPNDIYIGDKKICGILIENILSSSGAISKCVVGIGLNINQSQFLSDAPNPTSIIIEKNEETNRNELLNQFLLELYKLYNLLLLDDYDQIDKEYISYLYKYRLEAKFRDETGDFIGKIIEVKPQGELIIEKNSGEKCGYLFKEVAYCLE